MSDQLGTMKKRRSIRSYEDRPVPEEAIEKILEAGRWAPSALNHQPLRYVVVTDRALIEELSGRAVRCAARVVRWMPLLRTFSGRLRDGKLRARLRERASSTTGDPFFYHAPLLIIAVADKKGPLPETDLGCAAQNMMLEAMAMGIGSCLIGFASLLNLDRRARPLLGIPKGFRILAGIVFGYPRAVPRPPERRDCLLGRIGQ